MQPRLPAFSMSVVVKVSLKLPDDFSVKSGYIDATSSVAPPSALLVSGSVALGAHPQSASAMASTAATTASPTASFENRMVSLFPIFLSFPFFSNYSCPEPLFLPAGSRVPNRTSP